MNRVIVDTGFLVALGIARDPRHAAACRFLDSFAGELLVPAPVVNETCYFLSTLGKVRLLDWLRARGRKIIDVPDSAYPQIAAILTRYAALDPDFTDAAIVWVARQLGCRAIVTVDSRDFSTYRYAPGKRFDLIQWF